MKYLVLLLFCLINLYGFSQQNWSYQVWFNLYDKEGVLVTPEILHDNDYEILVTKDKEHIATFLNYNEENKCFVLIQRTTSKSETLLFVNGRDTAIINIPTQTFYAKEFRIIPGYYKIDLDKNGSDLAETNVQDIFPNRRIYSCTNAFLEYVVEEYEKKMRLYSESLIRVSLE